MVDFVLVSGLLALVFAGVVQVTLAVHVRNTLIDCAAEGARYAALADRTPQDGAARTRALIAVSLSPRYAEQVTVGHADVAGMRTVEVTVRAPMPVIGLLGPAGGVVVRGHGLVERP